MGDDMAERLAQLEARISSIEKQLAGHADGIPQKPLAVAELVRTTKVQTDVDKALVIGYSMEKYAGLPNFTVSELVEQFRAAREPPPSNANQTVSNNVHLGLMMAWPEKRDGQKCWGLTTSGENKVAGLLRASESA
jgi:hypothetical protein